MDRVGVGRAGFEVATLYEMGRREALEPVAHEIAEQLLDALLRSLPLGTVTAVDEPYVHRMLMTAARVGAGIGLVEVRSLAPPAGSVDRQIWGVLWAALEDLPTVPSTQRFAAAYLMQAGHWVARVGADGITALCEQLRDDTGPVSV